MQVSQEELSLNEVERANVDQRVKGPERDFI